VGIVVLLLGATGVFGQLQGSLNDIWEVKPKSRGLWGVIRDRLLSFSALLGLGFLLLVSLVLQAGLSAFSGLLGPAKSIISQVLNQLLSFGVTALLFALIFKLLPDLTIRWRGIWIGALFTALLFAVGKFLIGLYLGRGTVGSAFGAAGSLAIVLLWIYYSSLILFFGAEFTHVLSRRQGWVMAEESAAPAAPAKVPAAPRAGVAPPTLLPRPAPRPAVKPAGRVAGFFLGALGFLAGFLLGKRASV